MEGNDFSMSNAACEASPLRNNNVTNCMVPLRPEMRVARPRPHLEVCVWDHFTALDVGHPGNICVSCQHCGTICEYPSETDGYDDMFFHLTLCKECPYGVDTSRKRKICSDVIVGEHERVKGKEELGEPKENENGVDEKMKKQDKIIEPKAEKEAKKQERMEEHVKKQVEIDEQKKVDNLGEMEKQKAPKEPAVEIKDDKSKEHLGEVKEEVMKKKENEEQQAESVESNIVPGTFSRRQAMKALLEMVITSAMSSKQVEGIIKFMKVARPDFIFPSSKEIESYCYQLYLDEKKKLKSFIMENSERVCLTIDAWNSEIGVTYVCLGAQFIDVDWNLNRKILNFIEVPDYNGKFIVEAVEQCLVEWGIRKVFTVTMDNVISTGEVISYLTNENKNWDAPILKREYMYLRCLAHSINLVVNEALEGISDSISKIRVAISYLKYYADKLENLKAWIEQENMSPGFRLFLDFPDRWETTYKMLESVVKLQKAFERFKEEDEEYSHRFLVEIDMGPPDDQDWENIRVTLKFLDVFYSLIKKFSSFIPVTPSSYVREILYVEYQLHSWCRSEDSVLSAMSKNWKQKYEDYCGSMTNNKVNELLFLAFAFDPRFKLKYVEFSFTEIYGSERADKMIGCIKETLVHLFEQYNAHGSAGKELTDVAQPSNNMDVDGPEKHLNFLSVSNFKKFLRDKKGIESKGEVDRYLQESCEDSSDDGFDILVWWESNSSKYPILSRIARDVLAIPLCAVSLNSGFNSSNHVLDEHRSSLSFELAEGFVCAQNWIRCSQSHDGDKEPVDELEEIMSDLNLLDSWES